MKESAHRLRFWGVRGSIPTADADKAYFGGDTSCVEITPTDGTPIVFDGGTGIRGLGNQIARGHDAPYDIHLFLSHTHWDHIIGLPFFAPIHQPHAHIHFYGPQRAGEPLDKAVLGLFQSPYFPLHPKDINARLSFIELKNGRREFGNGFTIDFAPHPHPNGALSFRLQVGDTVITYVTDIEHTKDRLVPSVLELSRDSDVLIHDSHFHIEDLPTHRSWGHSSWEECTEIARRAGVKQLFLFHYSPNYTDHDIMDMEDRARRVFPGVTAAFQGLAIDLPAH